MVSGYQLDVHKNRVGSTVASSMTVRGCGGSGFGKQLIHVSIHILRCHGWFDAGQPSEVSSNLSCPQLRYFLSFCCSHRKQKPLHC